MQFNNYSIDEQVQNLRNIEIKVLEYLNKTR